MIPTIGRIVHYTLTEQDAANINKRRDDAWQHMREHQQASSGVVVHIGNHVSAGEIYPLVITRCWGDQEESAVNGQVLLDGADTLWVTSVHVGAGNGTFRWPERI